MTSRSRSSLASRGISQEPTEKVIASDYTRLPAWRTEDGLRRIVGYVHQLDVLRDTEAPLEPSLRRLLTFAPDLPVDRALARLRLSGQRLALVGPREAPWSSRGHFFVAASEGMRRILLDHAKARRRVKRGGGKPPLSLANVGELAVHNTPAPRLSYPWVPSA